PLIFGNEIVCTSRRNPWCCAEAVRAVSNTGTSTERPIACSLVVLFPCSREATPLQIALSGLIEFRLPQDLNTQLNLPRGSNCSAEGAGIRQEGASGIEDRTVGIVQEIGGCKIWVVQYIEDFRPELNVERLRDSCDAVVFENREIDGCQSRTIEAVATCI